MSAKSSPDVYFVGTIKVLVRAPSRAAANSLLRRRLLSGSNDLRHNPDDGTVVDDCLGDVIDYGFKRSGPDSREFFHETSKVDRDYLELMQQVRQDDATPAADGNSETAIIQSMRQVEYEEAFDQI